MNNETITDEPIDEYIFYEDEFPNKVRAMDQFIQSLTNKEVVNVTFLEDSFEDCQFSIKEYYHEPNNTAIFLTIVKSFMYMRKRRKDDVY